MWNSAALNLVLLNISTGPLEESTLDLPKWAFLSKNRLQNSPWSTRGKVPASDERLLNTNCTKVLFCLLSAFPSRIWFLARILALVGPANDDIWILWHVPRGSTWHPGSQTCLLETDMSSSSSSAFTVSFWPPQTTLHHLPPRWFSPTHPGSCSNCKGPQTRVCRILDVPLTTSSYFCSECYFQPSVSECEFRYYLLLLSYKEVGKPTNPYYLLVFS